MGIIETIKKRTPKKATDAAVIDATVVETEKTPKTPKAKTAKAKKTATVSASGKVSLHGTAHRVLIAPIVSEKSTVKEAQHSYTFLVEKNANKIDYHCIKIEY